MFNAYKSDLSNHYGYPSRDSDAFFYMGGYNYFGWPIPCFTNKDWILLWEPSSRSEAIKLMRDSFPWVTRSLEDGTEYWVYNARGGTWTDEKYEFTHSKNKNAVKIDGCRQRPRPIKLHIAWYEDDTAFQIMLDQAMEEPKPYEVPESGGFGNRKLKKLAGSTCGLLSAGEIDLMRRWVDYVIGIDEMDRVERHSRKIQNHSTFGSCIATRPANQSPLDMYRRYNAELFPDRSVPNVPHFNFDWPPITDAGPRGMAVVSSDFSFRTADEMLERNRRNPIFLFTPKGRI